MGANIFSLSEKEIYSYFKKANLLHRYKIKPFTIIHKSDILNKDIISYNYLLTTAEFKEFSKLLLYAYDPMRTSNYIDIYNYYNSLIFSDYIVLYNEGFLSKIPLYDVDYLDVEVFELKNTIESFIQQRRLRVL